MVGGKVRGRTRRSHICPGRSRGGGDRGACLPDHTPLVNHERMGTINLADLLQKIEDGKGTEKDLATLLQLSGFVKGRGYCTVVTGASVLVESSLRHFRREFEEHIAQQRCPYQSLAVGVA